MPVIKIKTNFQITIPQEVREKTRLLVGDYVEISEEKGAIVIKPVKFVPADTEDDSSKKGV